MDFLTRRVGWGGGGGVGLAGYGEREEGIGGEMLLSGDTAAARNKLNEIHSSKDAVGLGRSATPGRDFSLLDSTLG